MTARDSRDSAAAVATRLAERTAGVYLRPQLNQQHREDGGESADAYRELTKQRPCRVIRCKCRIEAVPDDNDRDEKGDRHGGRGGLTEERGCEHSNDHWRPRFADECPDDQPETMKNGFPGRDGAMVARDPDVAAASANDLPAQPEQDHDEDRGAAVEQPLADPPSPRVVRLEHSVDERSHDAHDGEQHDHRDNSDEQRARIGRLAHTERVSTRAAGAAR